MSSAKCEKLLQVCFLRHSRSAFSASEWDFPHRDGKIQSFLAFHPSASQEFPNSTCLHASPNYPERLSHSVVSSYKQKLLFYRDMPLLRLFFLLVLFLWTFFVCINRYERECKKEKPKRSSPPLDWLLVVIFTLIRERHTNRKWSHSLQCTLLC